jgi:hypothetical protein
MADRRIVLRVVFVGLVMLLGAACGDGAASTGDESVTTPTDSSSQSGGTRSTSQSGGTLGATSDPEEVSFDDLFSRRHELVGRAVEVVGTVHFVANCPPPGGQSGPCVLNGYFAEPDRDFLPFGDVGEAFPITEGGVRVSCGQAAASGGACPGWEPARNYEILAMVEAQVSGGRQTEQVELGVTRKTPA